MICGLQKPLWYLFMSLHVLSGHNKTRRQLFFYVATSLSIFMLATAQSEITQAHAPVVLFRTSFISRLISFVFTHTYKHAHKTFVTNVQSYTKMCFFDTYIQLTKLTENSWFVLPTQWSCKRDQLVSFSKELPNFFKCLYPFKLQW